MIKSYRVLRPIAWGGRRERGEIIEMTEESVANMNPDYLEEVVVNTVESEPVKPAEEIAADSTDSANAPSPEEKPAEGAEGQASSESNSSTESN